MIRKRVFILISIVYLIYFISLITGAGRIGDILSPVVTFIAFIYVFQGFYLQESNKISRRSGLLLSGAIFNRFLCDLLWCIFTLIIKKNPDDNFIIIYGYTLTNLMLLISILLSGYQQVKRWNRMQAFLDTVIISICNFILIWVVIFAQKLENIMILHNNFFFMFSLVADIVIYTWAGVWFFSIRKEKVPGFLSFTVAGMVVFAFTDVFYYYVYFYRSYKPNTLLDGAYIMAFALVAVGAVMKMKQKQIEYQKIDRNRGIFRKEVLFLLVPLVLLLTKGARTELLLFVIFSILLYFVLNNYAQRNIFQQELHQREKEYIVELEARVEARTREIMQLLNEDVITGLYSRRYCLEYLNKLTENIGKNENIILYYIDLNQFKAMQSMYGNYVVEPILKEVGNRLLESSDMEEGIVASYGEDVFIVVMKGSYSYIQGMNMAESIISRCSDVYHVEKQDIVVTLNIGVSIYPLDAKNVEDLVKHADVAMMQARTIGFNRTAVFNEVLGDLLNNKNKIEMKLKKVKYDEEFKLYYQPQVSSKDGSLIGFEALVRWWTKKGNYIPPSDFIPITEENGMIISLGYWILEKALGQIAEWKKHTSVKLRMAVNVSVKQLNDKEFIPRLASILQEKQVMPEELEIEITENIQMDENVEIKETLQKISDMGISVAVDDFGTGYSSLYYLKHLPIDRIKIAKPLIDKIEQDPYDHTIVKTVIDIAKIRGIQVIAEGVETKEQWECLKELECDEIQGYFFAKPMPAEEVYSSWIIKDSI